MNMPLSRLDISAVLTQARRIEASSRQLASHHAVMRLAVTCLPALMASAPGNAWLQVS